MRTGGAVLVLAAAVLWLWRYGVQRRQQRTLVWALAAAIGEMESAIRWQQTPRDGAAGGAGGAGNGGDNTSTRRRTWCKAVCLYSAHGKRLFLRYRTARPGRYCAAAAGRRQRAAGGRAGADTAGAGGTVPAAMPGGRTEEPGDDGCGAVRRGTGHHFTDMRDEPWMWI